MRAQGGGSGETRRYLSSPSLRSWSALLCTHQPVTDFSVDVVSDTFKGKVGRLNVLGSIAYLMPIRCLLQTTIQRHRMIHAALADEFAQGLHALSLKTKTEEELQKANSA